MLTIRQIHLEATRKGVAAEIHLCGRIEAVRGSSTNPSFAPVGQPRNLDWSGPGS